MNTPVYASRAELLLKERQAETDAKNCDGETNWVPKLLFIFLYHKIKARRVIYE
jgi:hypothetical protein